MRAGRDAPGAEGDGLRGHAAHGPCGWVEPHGFGEDLLGVAESGVVGEGGGAVGEPVWLAGYGEMRGFLGYGPVRFAFGSLRGLRLE